MPSQLLKLISELWMKVAEVLERFLVVRILLTPRGKFLSKSISSLVFAFHEKVVCHSRECTDGVQCEQYSMTFEESRRLVVDLSGDDAVALDEDLSDDPCSASLGIPGLVVHKPARTYDYSWITSCSNEAAANNESRLVRRRHDNYEADY